MYGSKDEDLSGAFETLQGAVQAANFVDLDQCSSTSFPFTFYDANGEQVNGVPTNEGICYFPTSDCGVNTSGRAGSCCSAAAGTSSTGGNYMFIAFVFVFIPIFFIKKYLREVWSKHPILNDTIGKDRTPSWLKSVPIIRRFTWLWKYGIYFGITAAVVIPIFMKPSIQAHLTVSSRNILQGAEAFLIPYKEVFQFVEDIVNVKINYALNSGDFEAVNSLLHLGIAGSTLTGVFAAVLASILGAIPAVLRALTNPGLSADIALYPGCDIVQAGASPEVSGLTLTYWMIETWKFVGTQVNMVIAGFLFGSVNFDFAGWMMAAGLGVIPLIWFTGLSTSIDPLILLAWAEFSSPYVTLLLTVLYLSTALGANIRESTGVSLSFSKLLQSFGALFRLEEEVKMEQGASGASQHIGDTEEGGRVGDNDEEDIDKASDSSVKSLVKEGLCIMFMDVMVQLAKSLAIYLALASDAATAYQLTALDSYLPQYGMAYTLGMAWGFKVFGTVFLSIKEYEYFFKTALVYIVCALLIVPIILGTTLPPAFNAGLALSSGENACEYAHSAQCVQFFTNIYGPNAEGGEFTLFQTFSVFAYGSAVESVFLVTRAIIITLLDFKYMMKSTVVAMVLYIAAMVVACVVQPFAKQAISFWIVMYIPQFILVLLFIGRLQTLYRRMVKGEVKGALRSRFEKKMSRVAANTDSVE